MHIQNLLEQNLNLGVALDPWVPLHFFLVLYVYLYYGVERLQGIHWPLGYSVSHSNRGPPFNHACMSTKGAHLTQ